MTTSLKDVSSAQMIHALVDMNCFEQEYVIYGYIWRDRTERVKITTSDQEMNIQRSFENKELEQYVMSPIQKWTTRIVMREETKEEDVFLLKLQLSQTLAEKYNNYYFNILESLIKLPPDSQAKAILEDWQREIDGYYRENDLILFEGAVKYAFQTKHLTMEDYQYFFKWIQRTRTQVFGMLQVKDNYERTFWGFAYEKSNRSVGYICNANYKVVLDRLMQLDLQGRFHTPVYRKKYCYHLSQDLNNVRRSFENEIHLLMDEKYLIKINELRSLIHQQGLQKIDSCILLAEKYCSKEAVEGIRYWGNRMNLIK